MFMAEKNLVGKRREKKQRNEKGEEKRIKEKGKLMKGKPNTKNYSLKKCITFVKYTLSSMLVITFLSSLFFLHFSLFLSGSLTFSHLPVLYLFSQESQRGKMLRV